MVMKGQSAKISHHNLIVVASAKSADEISQRLNRINGQIDGIIKMYEGDRSCIEIVRQIVAARNALSSVARELLTAEAGRCSREKNLEELDLIIKELTR